MGEVVRLPVKHADHAADPAADLDAAQTAPVVEDDGEALEGRVLVDRPDTYRPDVRARRLAGERDRRRPIIAPWLRDPAEAKATMRWAVGYAGHVTGYHAARIPLYSLRLAVRSPRGLCRVAVGTWRWTFDMDARPLRTHAIDRRNDEAYLKLMAERNDRVRARLLVTGAGLAGTGLAAASVAAAGGITQTVVLAALVALLGWIGTPTDRRILDTAVVSTKAPKLTSEIVVRALAALGIAEINKAVGSATTPLTTSPPRSGGYRRTPSPCPPSPNPLPHVRSWMRQQQSSTARRSPPPLPENTGCCWPTPWTTPPSSASWTGTRYES
ncbi:hypothetical protein [Thermocrispum agreste]|uniref:hypothetical protein n=1 Tax=Thermocrispum agreste TaxID=37925 RepID=UPI0004919B9E|nr:hypothetical protein [Thermocrispum agreste]